MQQNGMKEQRIVCETCGVVSTQTFLGVDAGLEALEQHKTAFEDIHIAAIVDAVCTGTALSVMQLAEVLGQIWGNVSLSDYRVAEVLLTKSK